MTHPLSGYLEVDESARTVRHYRYAVERMMRILGGWIALTPELSVKLLLGRHVWDNAQHADLWGKRLPELRAAAQVSEPANARLVAFLDTLEAAEAPGQTIERVVGVYRVLKPQLLATYEAHLAGANAVYEPPTCRILARCIEDERRHLAAGETILRHLLRTPALAERARACEARLWALLEAAGGVTGAGPLARASAAGAAEAPLSDDAREFIRLEQSTGAWPIAAELIEALDRFGDALVAGDLEAARGWLDPSLAPGPDLEGRLLAARGGRHRVVAFARVGAQRLVKLRVDGDGAGSHPAAPLGAHRRGLAHRRARARHRLRRAARLIPVLQSVLVANRGEIARRIIRACRALGIRSIAVYSEADAAWPHVADADEAVAIGPAPARQSYLDIERILEAARRTKAQAIHPGYGFLSENWRFAQACEAAGLVFVGPSWQVIQQMGDKIGARRLMAAAGVPVVPGSDGAVESVEAAREVAARAGYPIMLKAAAGGGGIGMMKVADEAALPAAFASAQRRAQAAFGSGGLFLERYVQGARHVEVQVFGDATGRVIHLHERECSIQRRHQKLVEESPAPRLPAALKARLTEAAVTGARTVGYVNAGTMEFIVLGDEFYFLEMNTRLQVEHPVTEEVTGLDLVQAQLRRGRGRAAALDRRADHPARLEHRVPDLRGGSRPRGSCRRRGA